MKSLKPHIILISLLAFGLMLVPSAGRADTASLYLTPASLSQAVGSNFTISVGVNAGGNAINAVEATVTVPGILGISGTSTGGSLCSVWVQNPTVSGSSVSFKCGIPGGTTASGNLMSISLHANAVGSGAASISAARVLAGPGQNVTGGTSGGTYTVTTAASSKGSSGTPAQPTTTVPKVSSGTHSDQNRWYTNNSPSFSWTRESDTTSVSYALDRSADTVPGTTANPVYATSATFPSQADGTWYFHIRANGPNGWSGTATYRIQIDTTAPTDLTIVTEPKVIADKRPMVSFIANDAASGVDHYDLQLDATGFKTVASPFTPDSITSGDHTFTVRAFDKAGNMVEGTAKITIKTIPAPKITSPINGSTLKLIEKLQLTGTADPSTDIDLYVDGKNVARTIHVAENGTWSYTYQTVLLPGKHTILAKAVKDGIESQPSSQIHFSIDPSAVVLLGSTISIYVVIVVLLIIIAILVCLVIWLYLKSRRQYHKIREGFIKKAQDTEKDVANSLDNMQHDIRHDIQATYGAAAKSSKDHHQLENQIADEISSTKRTVGKEIEDTTKDL